MESKLDTLLRIEGYDTLEDYMNIGAGYHGPLDSVVPGICKNEDCDATYDYEPDQEKGWCGECDTQTVVSILILMGVI